MRMPPVLFNSSRYLPIVLLSSVTLFAAWRVEAVEFYRCTEDGRVEFRQTPCPAGEQSKTRVEEQSGGMTPVEPALRLEPVKQTAHTAPAPAPATGQINEERCWKTEMRLQRIEQRLRAGYKASQYAKLHRSQEEYEAYLKRFCR